jgi:hypothetical protein
MITRVIDMRRIVGGDVDVEAKALNVHAHVLIVALMSIALAKGVEGGPRRETV